MNKQETQAQTPANPPEPDLSLSLGDYWKLVRDDQTIGGRTWGQSYVAVLMKVRPDIAEACWKSDRAEMIDHAERDLAVFLFYVGSWWEKR